ncbi:MAG TPA: hypothetical protein PLM29_06235 [Deltaproteobacteria bacterium]|nr:hypothetical protein [Deltaproteobacteria bacterium]HPR52846.1 hypothetical protein [Deltaproteobacteria bacterium]
MSSNRIEGVEVDNRRIGTIVFGTSLTRDRSEEEVRCSREALGLIHEQGAKLTVSEKTVLTLHRVACGQRALWRKTGNPRN